MARAGPLPALAVAAALFASSPVGAGEAPPGGGDAVVNSLGMRMVLAPAGSFRMGSPAGEPMRQEEETPRRVTLTRAFRIAATEVTQRQWLALMPSNPSPHKGDDLPVTSVSWKDAQEFCRALSQKEGVRYRLPTEAEWEYACRAGSAGPPVGRAELEESAWLADNSEEATHPVGRKRKNAWGLYDVLGNVAEWTQDVYGPYPRVEAESDPAGPATGATRVVRGGSWRGFAPALRCAARAGTPESYQLPHVGLRVVMEPRRATAAGPPTSSWNAFRAIEPGRRIDFVLVRSPVEVLQHGILSDTFDGRFPSDHLPLVAEIALWGPSRY